MPTGFLSVVFAALQSAAPCSPEQATALLESRRSEEIRAVLETCAERAASDARLAEVLGRLALSQGDSARAVKLFERAAAADPQNSELQLWLGRAYGDKAIKASVFEQPGLAGRVRKSFEKAVALDPGNLEARSAMLQYYLRAPRVLGGSPEKAREQARAIRDRDPLKGYRAWGRIAEQEKRFVEAGQEYDRAREEFPDRAEPYYWRAALAASLKDYARAFDVLESLLRAKPSELPACYEIGQIAAFSGQRLDRGEECLKAYLEWRPGPDDPPPAQAHLRLGALYEKKKNKALAREEYREALRLDPGLTEARAALAKISSVSSLRRGTCLAVDYEGGSSRAARGGRMPCRRLVPLGLLLGLAIDAFGQIPAPPVPPPPPLPSIQMRIVHSAPPPARREVIVYHERPGRDYVWTRGAYDWEEDRWVWVPGRWVARPARHAHWVRARYVHIHGHWHYIPGHWSNQSVVYVRE